MGFRPGMNNCESDGWCIFQSEIHTYVHTHIHTYIHTDWTDHTISAG